MATQQQANVYVTNKSDGHATITLSHNNSTNGTQTGTWDAKPGETVGPLTVYFKTGFGSLTVLDYWWISLTVKDGKKPGVYASSGSALSDWKECQLQSKDANQNLNFPVDQEHFVVNLKSGACKNDMKKTGPYSQITRVFVLMLENHSFDNMFAFSGIPGLKVATTNDSNAYNGKTYKVTKGAPPSMPTDPGHEFLDVVEQLAGRNAKDHYKKGQKYPDINLSGFASNYATTTTEGDPPAPGDIGDIMACFDTKSQLPVLYQLATEFAICDHWFSSLPGPTWPNRFFIHGASSAGLDHSPSNSEMTEWETVSGFRYKNGSIYDALNKAKITWRLYIDRNGPAAGSMPQVSSLHGIQIPYVHGLSSFAADLQGPYPYTYTFIEPNYGDILSGTYKGGSSQHPMDGVFGGEFLIKSVYEAIRNSPFWESSLFIITYDEHGGFYDSVKPTDAPKPGDAFAKGLNEYGFEFEKYGVRVPAVVVSPLIPKGTVDHTLYDHASVLATVERLYDVPHLTDRDKKANDLRHLLSLSSPRTNCPTRLNNPAGPATSFAVTDEDTTAIDGQPLPEDGNIRGFLQIMLKAEIELSSGSEAEKAEIIDNFEHIKTYGDAKVYFEHVDEKIDAAKEKSR